MVKFETLTIVYYVENRVRLTRPMSWERTTYTRRTKGMTRVTTQEIRRYNVADTTTSSNSGSCGGQRLVRQPSDWFLTNVFFYSCIFIAFEFVGSVSSYVIVIPATTANDLRLRRISIQDYIHYLFCPILLLYE